MSLLKNCLKEIRAKIKTNDYISALDLINVIKKNYIYILNLIV